MSRQRLQRVAIRNFQSLADVDLNLGNLTVIVGQSNAGKSAVVRALEAAMANWTGGAFVREGTGEAVVELTFAEPGPAGNVLRWVKPRKGGAHYVVSGGAVDREISRVGKEMPPEIDLLTGVREIEYEGGKASLQIDSQFDPPFLLAGTGGAAARLLGRVSKMDVLLTAQVRARRDMQRSRSAADDAEARQAGLEAQLVAFPDYEALLDSWRMVDARLRDVGVRAEWIARGRALVAERTRLVAWRRAWGESDLAARMADLTRRAEALQAAAVLLTRAAAVRAEAAAASTALDAARKGAVETERRLHEALGALEVCPVCQRAMV